MGLTDGGEGLLLLPPADSELLGLPDPQRVGAAAATASLGLLFRVRGHTHVQDRHFLPCAPGWYHYGRAATPRAPSVFTAGVVMDSGTVVSQLPPKAYRVVRSGQQ